jgi:hypothetical protein
LSKKIFNVDNRKIFEETKVFVYGGNNMKKFLMSLTVLSTSLVWGEAKENESLFNSEYSHSFSSKSFYRKHAENNYNYEAWGVGFEYLISKEEGINFRTSVITNPTYQTALVEFENEIFYRKPVAPDHYLYPIFSSKNSSHQIGFSPTNDIFINKKTLFLGMGWHYYFENDFEIKAEIQGFRDIHNIALGQKENEFLGQSYSNPWGARFRLDFISKLNKRTYLDVKGYYARTFGNCYSEIGAEISFKWSF